MWLEEALCEWKNENTTKKNTMYRGKDELCGTFGVEGRYILVQG
jgi:hypothetical protein